jgi:alpha-N-arabinofuranosidase
MVCSSFAMFPSTCFHSKDLVNWTDLGGVLNDVTQFNLSRYGY